MSSSKASEKSLYAPLDHDVIDSPAFADLNGEAVRVLNIVARQWNGQNNGQLQASYSFCQPRGVGSKHTLQKAVSSLIAHGFLYRTRGHGFVEGKNLPSRYAITWRPLTKNRKGLWCDGFAMHAYKKWEPQKKSEGQQVHRSSGKKCTFSLKTSQQTTGAKNALSKPAKVSTESAETAPYELLAINRGYFEVARLDWLTAELRKQAIKVRAHDARKWLTISAVRPKPCRLDWRNA